ncbi:DUF928 domain-containing protein [Leptolyngbya sp. FACHB-541]|uniref:DUF928 domain-containing protein n=1 Tax=Leptolyngbya sp. FACHB-541 TaxID=2692810 RepID=UPI0016862750|nr:DUF928 domain-containing protein [Leptolyngbya sp. FACHB-541]MBD2000263.1 DUF928 domain-containing protein [Leptolyngbya sp. FACHB-541]
MTKVSTRFNSSKHILVWTGVLLIGSMAIDFVFPHAQANSVALDSLQTKQVRGQVPGRRSGGARRGDCPVPSTELTALVPMTEVPTETLPETYVGGSTTVEYPTFWFYVPYSQTADLSAEFILQDDTGQDVYRITSADLSAFEQIPGIISISLPSTIAPLEIGRVYQWYFKLNCGTEAPTYVQGGIERIPLEPDLAYQLAHASPQERVNLYLMNDIWYDAITMLAQLHRNNLSNTTIESAWINLLQSLELENIPTDLEER